MMQKGHGCICDRIMERCVLVAFSGKNYRTDKSRSGMKNALNILMDMKQRKMLCNA